MLIARMNDDIACGDGVVECIVLTQKQGEVVGLRLLLRIFGTWMLQKDLSRTFFSRMACSAKIVDGVGPFTTIFTWDLSVSVPCFAMYSAPTADPLACGTLKSSSCGV